MRHTLILLATLGAMLLTALPITARDYNLPPGKWWENDRIVTHLGLTADQQGLIKDLVYGHATRMIDLNAALEKSKLALENQVDQEVFDPKAIRQFFAQFQEARRLLESERFEMLLSVRQVVTHVQWEKMLSLRERLEHMRQRPDGPRPGHRPPANGSRNPGGPRR